MPSFKTSFRVSWVDTDAAGIVHFSNYFKYFEKAEEELYRILNFNFESVAEKYGIILPRVEAWCRYKSPLRFNDPVEIEGYIVAVAADKNLGKAAKIPEEITEKLKAYMET